MSRILYSFSVIAFGLLLGYGVRLASERGIVRLRWSMPVLRTFLQRLALLGLGPFTFIGALWVVEIREPRLALLAGIGAFCHIFGGLAGALLARLFRLERPQAGAMFCCGFFTNIGAIGGLVTFVFLGEAGYAYVPLFKLFEDMVYYGVGFPVARLYSDTKTTGGVSLAARLARDPFLLVSIFSLTTGTTLNLLNVPRPEVFSQLNALLIPLTTVILLASIGMAMRFGKTSAYLKEGVAILGVKFLLVPAVCTSLAALLGLGGIAGGLPLKVVLVLSSMPVAFNALVPPSLYALDLDMANSCWLISVLGMAGLLPLLHVLLTLL